MLQRYGHLGQAGDSRYLLVARDLSADACLRADAVRQGHRGLVTPAVAVEDFLQDKPGLTPAPEPAGMHLPLNVVRGEGLRIGIEPGHAAHGRTRWPAATDPGKKRARTSR